MSECAELLREEGRSSSKSTSNSSSSDNSSKDGTKRSSEKSSKSKGGKKSSSYQSLISYTSDDSESRACNSCPDEYIFKLNLSGECFPSEVIGAGVEDTTCSIGPEPVMRSAVQRQQDEEDTFELMAISSDGDTKPVKITSVQILEEDATGHVVKQERYRQKTDLKDGLEDEELFTYTSIAATQPETIVSRITVVMRGLNANGDPLRNALTIKYTNSCRDGKGFDQMGSAGWVLFVSVVELKCFVVVHFFCTLLIIFVHTLQEGFGQ